MKNIFFPLFVTLFIFSCSSPDVKKEETKGDFDPSRVYFSDSGYSAIIITHDTVNGADVYLQSKETRSYNLVRLKRGPDYVNLLITETSRQAVSLESEGQTGTIDLTGRISEGGNLNKEIWKKHIDANSINYGWDYFEAENFGCCAAVEGRKIYRYSDGEELIDYTGDLYEIEIPNTDISRYVGFKSTNSANTFTERSDSLFVGMLTYVDPLSRSTQLISVTAKSSGVFDEVEMANHELKFALTNSKDKYNENSKILQLWSADKISDQTKIDGFSVELRFDSEKRFGVIIPVRNGKLMCGEINSEVFTVKELK